MQDSEAKVFVMKCVKYVDPTKLAAMGGARGGGARATDGAGSEESDLAEEGAGRWR